MKIERINENQIRCTLTSFDLSARNINLVELAYGTEKARKLFREMIQKASNEVGFEAEDRRYVDRLDHGILGHVTEQRHLT